MTSLDIKQWEAQKRGWQTLNELRAVPIELARLRLLEGAKLDCEGLETLLPQLGLNDEALDEFPAHLLPYCGQGLRIWQYPNQFAPYLEQLIQLKVQSYLELGVRHGGSFVATVEILRRAGSLNTAIAVDIIACPAMAEYTALSSAEFWQINTQSQAFFERLRQLGHIDLVMIDTHHEEKQCLQEFDAVAPYANMIALHDIHNIGCPGVGQTWREIRARKEFHCLEFIDQYPGLGPFMGIGLAIKRERWNPIAHA